MADTIGAQLPQPDPRGWLVFDALPDDMQRAEDSTQAADYQRTQFFEFNTPAVWGTDDPDQLAVLRARARKVLTQAGMSTVRAKVRPATDTERLLLQHLLGYTLPAELFTAITFLTTGVRNRRFPQLEEVTTP